MFYARRSMVFARRITVFARRITVLARQIMVFARLIMAWGLVLATLAAPARAQQGSLLGVPTAGTPQGPQPAQTMPGQTMPAQTMPGQTMPGPILPPTPPKGGTDTPIGFGIVQVRTTLNVRTGPWGQIIGSLGPNSVVKIIGREGPWYIIEFNGQRGYVHSQYIFTPNNNPYGNGRTPPSVVQNPNGSVVRATPWGNTVGNIPPGTPVQILGRTNDWWMVSANGVTGYVPVSALDPRTPMPGVPQPRYGVPGYTGPSQGGFVAPGPLGVPGSSTGRGARAATGSDRHPNLQSTQLQVFPVPGATKYSDDWGIGTHSAGASPYNMGIDIFAPTGSPILAPVGGRITQVSSNSMGGQTIHLVGPDGTDYYFAHLSGYAPGIRPGMMIPAGTTIGFVGTTGNAQGGPSHLHFAAVRNGQAIPGFRGLTQCP